ncbi:hypothetical protein [Allosalinactinospora lopnorensis]|uniref:hypothetical protein n=1 Tax=Allosalinactinospora lopnorensis TaxID=1352348 RepID=UPI000623CCC4|nr:hypothetical protein [Allosalinactinospora lopnorensis]
MTHLRLDGVETYAQLRAIVADRGGYGVTEMVHLRDLTGKQRLKRLVCEKIADSLYKHGIGHVPADLPRYQDAEVRLYLRETLIGGMIDAVLFPDEEGDEVLIHAAAAEKAAWDARERLRKIKEIVDADGEARAERG